MERDGDGRMEAIATYADGMQISVNMEGLSDEMTMAMVYAVAEREDNPIRVAVMSDGHLVRYIDLGAELL